MDVKGAEVNRFDLDPTWLERERGEQAVHDSVVAFQAKSRAGTASTKTRAEVRGGGAKPWRQKGTGRARAGSNRSPIWRGGGISFGPKPRSFAKRVNRKVEGLALRRALTERIDAGDVIVVESLPAEQPKTKAVVSFLNVIGAGSDVLVIVDETSRNFELAVRNLTDVVVMKAGTVNTYWLLLFRKIVMTRAGLEVLGKRLAPREKAR